MAKELILEIGAEEIPAGFLNYALKDLEDIAKRELDALEISYDGITTLGTPRRMALHITGLEEKQPDKTVEYYGPPKRIAFDEKGKPTKAAIGFAKSQGVSTEDLVALQDDRGEFVGIRKKVRGEMTSKLLQSMLPDIMLKIPFRKSMKWGDVGVSFVRPIRWIAAVFAGKKLDFSVATIKAGDISYGHRFLAPDPFRIEDWKGYLKALKKRYVIPDHEERKERIWKDVQKKASELKGIVESDEDLLETVANLVEYPVVLVGAFEKEFLNLPKEALISVMKTHQKYFPVYGDNDALLPYFIFVSGTKVKKPRVVVEGNERVIRARFTDAKFFYEEDTKKRLEEHTKALADMVYLSDLGSYLDKTRRLEALASFLGVELGLVKSKLKSLERAAFLSKADLATQMVFEFPELEGIMGGYYSQASGENESVATAIEEHYMPRSREDDLPGSDIGSALSLCDKLDNIASCFTAGLIPTGASDPYALRRQAIAIINIIFNKKYRLSINKIFSHILELVAGDVSEQSSKRKKKFLSPEDALENSVSFIRERFRNLMISDGHRTDVVEAVISCGCDDLVDAKSRIEALSEFTKAPGFEALAIAFKRVVNIVGAEPRDEADKNLFIEKEEKALYKSYLAVMKDFKQSASEGNYSKLLTIMKTMKEPVDKFFDEVLVMDKDIELRNNRLALLWGIRNLFFTVADFSKLSA